MDRSDNPDIILTKDTNMDKITKEFRRLLGDEEAVVLRTERLGGMNNENYRVVSDRGDFALRMPGSAMGATIDREAELINTDKVRVIGIDVDVLKLDPTSGGKLSRYVSGAETLSIESAKQPSNLSKISEVLKLLHNYEIRFVKDFDPVDELKTYEEIIENSGASYFEGYLPLRDVLPRLVLDTHALGFKRVPTHLDPWPENFIIDTEGKLLLIDWEYCANYDASWDLGAIWLELNLTEQEMDGFLTRYYGAKVLRDDLRKIKAMLVLIDVYWAMWALAKYALGELELYKYANDRFVRAQLSFQRYRKEFW